MDIAKFQEVKTTGGKMLNKVKMQKIHTLDYIEKFLAGKATGGRKANQVCKQEVFTFFNAGKIAYAITQFAFRNSPVEDRRASPKDKLTQKGMKLLKKTMHNRLVYIFTLIAEDRWMEFKYVITDFMNDDSQWNKAEPDNQGYTERCLIDYTEFINTPEKE